MTDIPPASAHPRPSPFWSLIEAATIVAFLAMLAVMFVQVASRYALGVGVPWTDETSRYLFVAQIFLGGAVAERYGAHVRITIFLDLLPDRARLVMEMLGGVLVLAIAAALIVGCVRMIASTSNVAASTIPITMAWVYAVQGLGIGLYALLVGRDLGRRLAAATRGDGRA